MIPTRGPGPDARAAACRRGRAVSRARPRVRGRGGQRGARRCCSPRRATGTSATASIPPTRAASARRAAAERAREIARRLGRPDLELIALDSLSSGLNIRGLYGLAEPIDRERLEIARTHPRPVRGRRQLLHGRLVGPRGRPLPRGARARSTSSRRWASTSCRIGPLSLAVLAQVPLGDWDEALADQARLRELLGERRDRPPSMASGGYGAEPLHPRGARRPRRGGRRARRDRRVGRRRRDGRGSWAIPLAAVDARAPRRLRRGARGCLDRLRRHRPLPRPRARGALHAGRRGGLVGRGGRVDRRGRGGTPSAASCSRCRCTPTGSRVARCSPPATPRARSRRSSAPPRDSRGSARPGRPRSPSSRSARRSPRCGRSERCRRGASTRAAAVFERLRVPRELARAEALLGPACRRRPVDERRQPEPRTLRARRRTSVPQAVVALHDGDLAERAGGRHAERVARALHDQHRDGHRLELGQPARRRLRSRAARRLQREGEAEHADRAGRLGRAAGHARARRAAADDQRQSARSPARRCSTTAIQAASSWRAGRGAPAGDAVGLLDEHDADRLARARRPPPPRGRARSRRRPRRGRGRARPAGASAARRCARAGPCGVSISIVCHDADRASRTPRLSRAAAASSSPGRGRAARPA